MEVSFPNKPPEIAAGLWSRLDIVAKPCHCNIMLCTLPQKTLRYSLYFFFKHHNPQSWSTADQEQLESLRRASGSVSCLCWMGRTIRGLVHVEDGDVTAEKSNVYMSSCTTEQFSKEWSGLWPPTLYLNFPLIDPCSQESQHYLLLSAYLQTLVFKYG